jgi:signal transduction histidine kinase
MSLSPKAKDLKASKTRSHFGLLHRFSLRTRLTFLFVFIFGFTLTLFGALTFRYLATTLQKEFDDALYNYAVDVADSVILDPTGDLLVSSATVDKEKIYPFSLGTALIQIRHIKGSILSQVGTFGKLDLPWKDDFKRLSHGEDSVYRTINKLQGLPNAEANSYRVINVPLDNSPSPQLILQIAVPRTFLELQIQNRKFLLYLGIPITLLIASVAGFLLLSRALAPIKEIIQKTRAIGAHALSERLPVPESRDEVQALSITLNDMLSRIDRAFQSQDRFIADASHQLLTPLTIMKGELGNMLRAPEKISPEAIESSLQEVNHLTALVRNLLILAQVDAGKSSFTLQKIYFEDVVLEAIAKAEKVARQKNTRIKFDLQGYEHQHPQILGDPDLLTTLVFNLIENAVKYSPPNSVVSIVLKSSAQQQKLSVTDSGPGIPADQIETIFERFSRARNVDKKATGYGLGLAIAQQIAYSHNAKLSVHNRTEAPGTRFELEIDSHSEIKNN